MKVNKSNTNSTSFLKPTKNNVESVINIAFYWTFANAGGLLPDTVADAEADKKQGASRGAGQSSSRHPGGLWRCSTGSQVARSPPGHHLPQQRQWWEISWLQAGAAGWGTEAEQERWNDEFPKNKNQNRLILSDCDCLFLASLQRKINTNITWLQLFVVQNI